LRNIAVKNLLQNPIFHRHIEAECLEDIYKFDDLDIAEYKNIGSSKDIKNIFIEKMEVKV